jgi:hypothetical protein
MTLSEALDQVEDELGLEPIGIGCDGHDCDKKLTRHDESYSQRVGECQMFMVLCPDCAEKAGWVDE